MGITKSYIVNLKKNVFVEEDPSKNCQDYPNADFETYGECDDHFMKEYVATSSPGLVPIWLTEDLDNVTTLDIIDYQYDYDNLYDGTKLSDCPLPCTTISTKTSLLSDYITGDGSTTIDITFSSTVQVTTTDFVQLNLSTFLSDVGGSVGLWLGLGVVQALQLFMKYTLPWINTWTVCKRRR
jgi:hypothetical protein